MQTDTNTIEKQILLRAPRSRVWRALTDAAEFGSWFQVVLEGEFRAGMPITGRMTYPGYEGTPFEAIVAEIVPESLFSFRWYANDVDLTIDHSEEPTMLVEFRLEDAPGGTLLSVTESGFDVLPPERRGDAFIGNSEGWEIQTQALAAYVGSAS